jgi:acetolactate synthase I/II/III large subunit
VNGAGALISTLVDGGVDVCFANPGTSEMHFVAALDTVPRMRSVLALFEGVATGAADGYARIAGRPAAVLLHLGPGLGNGLANLHNAKRAHVPMVVVVGDHATYHKKYDAPLESDIDALANSVSGWVRRSTAPIGVGADTADAVTAAATPPGRIATLILPADVSWSDGAAPGSPSVPDPSEAPRPDRAIEAAAEILRGGDPAVLFLGGDAIGEEGLLAASRIAVATGARLLCETFPTKLARGAGLPVIDRLGYFAEQAAVQLNGTKQLILAGARSPVSFFAYPNMPSDLVPSGCDVHNLAEPGQATAALTALADEVAPTASPVLAPLRRPALPTGPLTAASISDAIGALLPENAIVVDETNTSGVMLPTATAGAPRHDWLTLTGGAIGYGLPCAVGAAVAAPDRQVLALQADGSAMYTPAALWTMAREGLNVTTVLYNNGAYDILRLELQRVGAQTGGGPGPRAEALLDLTPPRLDFVALANGMGVTARRATTAEEFTAALAEALAADGPYLIDAVIPSMMG